MSPSLGWLHCLCNFFRENFPVRNKDGRFGTNTGFAATGAQRVAMHGHFDPQPVWSSRFEQVKMLPLHRTRPWTPESSQELPCRCHNLLQAWMFPEEGLGIICFVWTRGRKVLPKTTLFPLPDPPKLISRLCWRNLVTAENTKVAQGNRSSQCKCHSGLRECAWEVDLSVLCLPM